MENFIFDEVKFAVLLVQLVQRNDPFFQITQELPFENTWVACYYQLLQVNFSCQQSIQHKLLNILII
jgi:hypothetical protein